MAEAEDSAVVPGLSKALEVASMPYADRQLVVVARDEVVALKRASEVAVPEPPPTSPGRQVMRSLAVGIGRSAVPPLAFVEMGFITVELGMELVRSRRRANEKGFDVFVISRSEAAPLAFPVGHPRDRVVYVGHPADPAAYIPMADFHRSLFEHKVAEALRLVTSLGATEVAVEHVSGWTSLSEIGAGLAVPSTTPVEVGVNVQREATKGHRVMSRMDLAPQHAPTVPDDLAWYAHEPLWREVRGPV